MRPRAMEVLRCPACRGGLDLRDAEPPAPSPEEPPVGPAGNEGEIESGTLACENCSARYRVEHGVPDMLVDDGMVRRTRKGFEYQWSRRQRGRAERRRTVYGYDIEGMMAWLTDTFTTGLRADFETGAWLLDAGCGSAEKARELALRFPEHQVVAMDQSASLAFSAREHADVPNLHFVRGNVWFPPFAERAFGFVMSIGVLHHTPDTRRAFGSIADLVAPGGDLMSWIYPLPEEDAFWAGFYRHRDRHFLGIGHRLPPWLTMAWCYAYVSAFFPFVRRFLKEQHKRYITIFPPSMYPKHPGRRQLYHSAVFLAFDNAMPTHQFRHGKEEVESWYGECGFTGVDSRFPGFFGGQRADVRADAPTTLRSD